MKSLTLSITLFAVTAFSAAASAQSSSDLAIEAFQDSSVVMAEVDAQLEDSGLELGDIKTIIQDTGHISGIAGTSGHDLVLVAQTLRSPINSFHPTFTSVLALVSVSYDSTALQPIVSEPQLVTIGDLFLTALYSPIVTEKLSFETFTDAANRALHIAADDTVDELLQKGYQVVSSDLIQLTLGRTPDGGLTALFAGSVHMAQSSYNGHQVTLNGYFYKDPVGDSVRGTIIEPVLLPLPLP